MSLAWSLLYLLSQVAVLGLGEDWIRIWCRRGGKPGRSSKRRYFLGRRCSGAGVCGRQAGAQVEGLLIFRVLRE